MIPILNAILIALTGNALIYAGLAFVNTELLPKIFQPVYETTNVLGRLVIMLVCCSMLANWLFSVVYKMTDAGNAGMIILGTLVIVMVAKSLWIEGLALTPRIAIATGIALLSVMWVAYEMHVKP